MRLLPSVLLLLLLAPCAALAQGDTRIAFLGRQLQQGKDPRTRSQAALVLGATEDPEAVALLCGALKDASELVRSAAAKGWRSSWSRPGSPASRRTRPRRTRR